MRRFGLVVVLALCGTAHAAPDPDRVDRAARKVLDRRFQDAPTGYPDRPERDREVSSGGGGGGSHRGLPSGGSSPSAGGAGALSPIIAMLMWALLIAGAVIVVFYVIKELAKGGRKDRVRADDPVIGEEPVPAPAELDRPLEDADALARQGKFAEAIHTLLLRTFQELARASKISPHLTSREILAKIPLLTDGRDALGELVAVVELTWFGDDVPGEPEWLRCRAQFDRFVAIHRASVARQHAKVAEAAA